MGMTCAIRRVSDNSKPITFPTWEIHLTVWLLTDDTNVPNTASVGRLLPYFFTAQDPLAQKPADTKLKFLHIQLF